MIEAVWPKLGMDPLSFEGRLALKLGLIALVIAVVARTHQQETAAVAPDTFGRIDRQLPLAALATPVSGNELLTKADSVADAVLICSLVHVAQNRRPVGDAFFRFPGFEIVSQGMHVTVRANAGITEQVPGAADRVASLQ